MIRSAATSLFAALLLSLALLASGCDFSGSSDDGREDLTGDLPTSVYNGVSIELAQGRVAEDAPLDARIVNNSPQTVRVVASSPCSLPLLERQQGEGLWSRVTLQIFCAAVVVNDPVRPDEAYPIRLSLDYHEPGEPNPVYIRPGTHRLVVAIAPEADTNEGTLLASPSFTITED